MSSDVGATLYKRRKGGGRGRGAGGGIQPRAAGSKLGGGRWVGLLCAGATAPPL